MLANPDPKKDKRQEDVKSLKSIIIKTMDPFDQKL